MYHPLDKNIINSIIEKTEKVCENFMIALILYYKSIHCSIIAI